MKPTRFYIKNFKGIMDSGWCTLSGDNITVFAGQNEAGKSTVLQALRDFDLPIGSKPLTEDYFPTGYESTPLVTVEFEMSKDDIQSLTENDISEEMAKVVCVGNLQVTRDLKTGTYTLDDEHSNSLADAFLKGLFTKKSEDSNADEADHEQEPGEQTSVEQMSDKAKNLGGSAPTLYKALRLMWPEFIYFDTFNDLLPKAVPIAELPGKDGDKLRIVRDFLSLARVDVEKVKTITVDRELLNYLRTCTSTITEDFLTYWSQCYNGRSRVSLKVAHHGEIGKSVRLAFYVFDGKEMYPEQRSKGFLWFLSFYLRLHSAEREGNAVLLIDEPGSYLHAKAQQNVLEVLSKRAANGDMVLYTTHSPYLLPADKMHRIRIVANVCENGTKVYDRLTHSDLNRAESIDAITPILTSIGIDAISAFGKPREFTLLAEGISDKYYLEKILAQCAPELAGKVSIIPSMGASKVPFLASVMIGWGVNFAVLLDRDKAGDDSRRALIEDLDIDDSKIIQPKDAITIEDVLGSDLEKFIPHESLTEFKGITPSQFLRGKNKALKIEIARAFSASSWRPSAQSKNAVDKLIKEIRSALEGNVLIKRKKGAATTS